MYEDLERENSDIPDTREKHQFSPYVFEFMSFDGIQILLFFFNFW